MGPSHRLAAALASVLLLHAQAGAQEVRATIGRFVDLEDRPLPNATVTFAAAPPPTWDLFAPPLLVQVTTDDAGRFRAELRTGLAWSAWAIGQESYGRRFITAVVDDVVAGNVLDLRAARGIAPQSLQVIDAGFLRGRAPHRVVVRSEAQSAPEHELALGPDGQAQLPPLPDAALSVRVLDADGRVVLVPTVNLLPSGANFAVPPLLRLPVRVRDAQGKPVAGALLRLRADASCGGRGELAAGMRMRDLTMDAGVTDADGAAVIEVHAFGDPMHGDVRGELLCSASAPGCAETWSGWSAGACFVDGHKTPPGELRELPFTLRPAPPLRGRLLQGGKPLAGHGVLLTQGCRLHLEDWGWVAFQRQRMVRTDEDGAFAFESPSASAMGLHLGLQPTKGGSSPQLGVLGSVPPEPLRIDLDALPVVTLQAVTDRGPVASGRGMLLPARSDVVAAGPGTFLLDRAGRVRMAVQPGSWLLFVTDGSSARMQRFEVKAEPGPSSLTVALEPLPRMRGLLLDADGRPIAGATLQLGATVSGPLPVDATDFDKLVRHYVTGINHGLIGSVRTAADGAFDVHFFAAPGVEVHASFLGGKDFVLQAADDLELRHAPR